MENLGQELEIVYKIQNLELKDIIIEMTISINGLNNRLDVTEKRFSRSRGEKGEKWDRSNICKIIG